jgi:curved DNA-binding protein
MDYRDYYKALGVERDADADTIKRAWRRIARKHHPDVDDSADASERFKAAGEAYEVLKDPEKRAAYDALGAGWHQGEAFRPPPDWQARDFDFSGGGYTEADPGAFSAFFEELFGRRARGFQAEPGATAGAGPGDARFAAAGQDQHATLTVDLRDSFHGATRKLTLQVPEIGADGRMRLRDRTLSVTIPKGIAEGQTIRLKGQGGAGIGGGPAGNLYLDIAFAPDPVYTVAGRDLTRDLPVAAWEAALGARVGLPTPAGPVEVTVPAGARPGQKLRLRGRGLPGTPPGDLFATLRIVAPKAGSAAQRADAREYDAVVAAGEQVTAGLMALTLQEMGVPARSWQGWQVPVRTTAAHGAARIEAIETEGLTASSARACTR